MNEKPAFLIKLLLSYQDCTPASRQIYFKTGPGDYAEHEKFLGISVPTLRKFEKKYREELSEKENLMSFLSSPYNECRFLGALCLVNQFKKQTNLSEQEKIFQFYLSQLNYINNWNLVDVSAHEIVGKYLFLKNQGADILYELVRSPVMWFRRVAIVSSWAFIKENHFTLTQDLATLLLADPHDLIHKATGWMLREMGKKNKQSLIDFLAIHAAHMPRTMLRYAIEKFPKDQQKHYLSQS